MANELEWSPSEDAVIAVENICRSAAAGRCAAREAHGRRLGCGATGRCAPASVTGPLGRHLRSEDVRDFPVVPMIDGDETRVPDAPSLRSPTVAMGLLPANVSGRTARDMLPMETREGADLPRLALPMKSGTVYVGRGILVFRRKRLER